MGSETHHRPVGSSKDTGRSTVSDTSHVSEQQREWGWGGEKKRQDAGKMPN